MKVEVKDAIDALTEKAMKSEDSNDALKFSQAALNLANASATVTNAVIAEKRG